MDAFLQWLPALISLIGTTVVTTIIGIFIKRIFDKRFKQQDEEKEKLEEYEKIKAEKLREDMRKDIREEIEKAVAPLREDLFGIKKGTQAGLRHDLCIMADEWLNKGYCPREVKVDFENIYNQYHLLGKNGVMDNIYQKILVLPETKAPTKRKVVVAKKQILNENS